MVQKPLEILEQRVLVLVDEAIDCVNNIASVVTKTNKTFNRMHINVKSVNDSRYAEIHFVPQFLVHRLQLPTREMLVMCEFLIHGLQKHLVVHFSDRQASLVHDRNDAFVRRFHQITNDLIVEVLNVGPFNAFALIFLLFLLQHEFDEKLLEFFVAVVDAVSELRHSIMFA